MSENKCGWSKGLVNDGWSMAGEAIDTLRMCPSTTTTTTHLWTISSNDRHGGPANISGADAANLQIKPVAHVDYRCLMIWTKKRGLRRMNNDNDEGWDGAIQLSMWRCMWLWFLAMSMRFIWRIQRSYEFLRRRYERRHKGWFRFDVLVYVSLCLWSIDHIM